MSNWIFVGTMIYAFAATALIRASGQKESFIWFGVACVVGIPVPFLIQFALKD